MSNEDFGALDALSLGYGTIGGTVEFPLWVEKTLEEDAVEEEGLKGRIAPEHWYDFETQLERRGFTEGGEITDYGAGWVQRTASGVVQLAFSDLDITPERDFRQIGHIYATLGKEGVLPVLYCIEEGREHKIKDWVEEDTLAFAAETMFLEDFASDPSPEAIYDERTDFLKPKAHEVYNRVVGGEYGDLQWMKELREGSYSSLN